MSAKRWTGLTGYTENGHLRSDSASSPGGMGREVSQRSAGLLGPLCKLSSRCWVEGAFIKNQANLMILGAAEVDPYMSCRPEVHFITAPTSIFVPQLGHESYRGTDLS
jgi:hypothetical protein